MSDETLRAAYREQLMASHDHGAGSTPSGEEVSTPLSGARSRCPSPELLASLARGEGMASSVDLLEHALQCEHCFPEFELLRTIAQAEHAARTAEAVAAPAAAPVAAPVAAASVAARTTRQATRSSHGARWALAATVLLAVMVGGTWWGRRAPSETGSPAVDPDVVRSVVGDIVVVGPRGDLTAEPHAFTWRPGARSQRDGGDVHYVVEAFDSLGTLLLSRTSADTALVLSTPDVAALRRVRTFDWVVYADRGDGNQRRSGMTRVRMPNVVQDP